MLLIICGKNIVGENLGIRAKMVSDLMKEGDREWDIELVKSLFLPQDVEAILSTSSVTWLQKID